MSNKQVYTDTSDSLARLAEGSTDGLRHFHNKYYTSLVFFANSIIANGPQAEDIASECFIKLWSKRADIETEQKLRAYLFTIVRNASLDYLRQQRASNKLHALAPVTDTNEDIELKLVSSELFRLIYEEIQRLPGQFREVIELVYLHDIPSAQAAAKLGITMDNFRQRKTRGIRLLKTGLLKKGIDSITLYLLFFH